MTATSTEKAPAMTATTIEVSIGSSVQLVEIGLRWFRGVAVPVERVVIFVVH